MLNVTIDPGVFAPPFDSRSKESVKAYVDSLLHWREAGENGPVELHVPRRTAEVLIRAKYYPFRPWLKQLLAETKTFEFDANTIAVLAESILAHSAVFEDSTKITDVLAERLAVDPDIFINYVPREVQSESETTALISAIVRSIGRDIFAVSNRLAVRSGSNAHSVAIRALLVIIEHARHDLHDYSELPKPYEGDAPICETLHDYLLALDECDLWDPMQDAGDLETLIKIAVYKSRAARGEAVGWTKLPPFRFHQEFYASARACVLAAAHATVRAFLRAMVEAIDGQNLADVHALRCDKGPNSDQVMRGTDTAWRRDVDRDFHIHYWLCYDGVTEFARVVHHNDFGIPV